jgi:dipeptidyl aminopeptidase/acylaminoacyl peptidase
VTRFDDLADYVTIPRVTALRLSPDGSWLAAAVQTAGGEPRKYVTSIWRIPAGGDGAAVREADPGRNGDAGQGGHPGRNGDAGQGGHPGRGGDRRPEVAASRNSSPARLTRSAEGEGAPEFLPDGSLLFLSRRPGPPPDGPGEDDIGKNKPALWLLPEGGGEARRIAAPPGGVTAIAAARAAGAIVFVAPWLDGASGADDDAKRRKARKDAGVTAILHQSGPVRYWDHDLGPDCPRLLVADVTSAWPADAGASTTDEAVVEPRDLTPDPGRALDEQAFDISPGGELVATGWSVWDETGNRTVEVHVIDTRTGVRRPLLAAPGADFEDPRISPDGRLVACLRATHDSYDAPGDVTLVVAALDDSTAADSTPYTDLLHGMDRRPLEVAWAPDSGSVYFTADDQGRRPVFRADLATGEIARLTADDGAYDNLCPAPDGRLLYALRSAVDEPPAPVRLDITGTGGHPVRLASPGSPLALPGRLQEVEATADDGARIRAWLVLPDTATADQPAPLLLWVHGGPVMSWNAWSWRWNPWLMAARGYAVLLPDPALSTGYGHHFIARGHGQWGGQPYADLMAITDAAVARPDIDESRTAMMGGSYGGYMANWIAGHTGRFRAIVSHAGLWALDQMFGTTDLPSYWRRIFGDPATQPDRYLANSPNRHVGEVSTPMLVIHGDKDYRVPVGEALRLWWDLQDRAKDARFLYFPDENHWILTPGHATVWYETVLAFLGQHVLGEPWQRPGLL